MEMTEKQNYFSEEISRVSMVASEIEFFTDSLLESWSLYAVAGRFHSSMLITYYTIGIEIIEK